MHIHKLNRSDPGVASFLGYGVSVSRREPLSLRQIHTVLAVSKDNVALHCTYHMDEFIKDAG